MSSREPMWYCHECHAEMRPLMVPDPHCASCNGTFVERLENPADDPRDLHGPAGGVDDDPFAADEFLFGLSNLLRAARGPNPAPGAPRSRGASPTNSPPRQPGNGSGFTFSINRSTGPDGQSRTTFSTRPTRRDSGEVPTLSDFLAQSGVPRDRQQGRDRDPMAGPLMLQYLLSALSQHGTRGGGPGPFAGLFGLPPGAENGRWGDYVFNQQALDEIITQIMENSQAHPAPATEEIMSKLPREVLESNSPLLEKDCAVCKDQFSLGTEDPEEQVVVTLPCDHPFHEPCIMPWLKSSGTCPVCRYQLVPQPEHHPPGSGPPNGNSGRRTPGANDSNGGGGILNGIFNALGSYASSSSSNPSTSSTNTTHNRSNSWSSQHQSSPSHRPSSGSSSHERRGSRDNRFPGSWGNPEVD